MCLVKNSIFYKPIVNRINIVDTYNSSMNGTDMIDQLASYYETSVRSKKWPTRIYTHFLMVSVINAYIIFKKRLPNDYASMPLVDFIESIISDVLIKPYQPINTSRSAQLLYSSQFIIPDPDILRAIRSNGWLNAYKWLRLDSTKYHCPTIVSQSKECRRTCVVCGVVTSFICLYCNAGVCVKGDIPRNCFYRFHNLENFHIFPVDQNLYICN